MHFCNPHPLLNKVGALTIEIRCNAAGGTTKRKPGTLKKLEAVSNAFPPILAAEVLDEEDGFVYRFIHHNQNVFGVPSRNYGQWIDNRFGGMTFTDYCLLWQPFKHEPPE